MSIRDGSDVEQAMGAVGVDVGEYAHRADANFDRDQGKVPSRDASFRTSRHGDATSV